MFNTTRNSLKSQASQNGFPLSTDFAPANLHSSKARPIKSAIERAAKRASANRSNAGKLGRQALIHNDIESLVDADLLGLSASKSGNGEIYNVEKEYSCAKNFAASSNRIDSSYQAETSARYRRRIRREFTKHIADIIEFDLSIKFLTPTFPNLLGRGFEDNHRFLIKAWELFLQRESFKATFYGGYNRTEPTQGGKRERARTGEEWSLEKHGINFHNHILAIVFSDLADGDSFRLEDLPESEKTQATCNTLKLAEDWTKCCKIAHEKLFGEPLKINTKSGNCRFHVKSVPLAELENFDAKNPKGILFEFTKISGYTAKGITFDKLPESELYDVNVSLKNKKFLSPFGVFQKRRQADFSDDLVKDVKLQSCDKEESGIKAHKPTDGSLENTERGLNERLRSYGIRLRSSGHTDVWLKYLEINAPLIIQRKIEQYLERFPASIFTDLDGKKHYGWKAAQMVADQTAINSDKMTDDIANRLLFRDYQTELLGIENRIRDSFIH